MQKVLTTFSRIADLTMVSAPDSSAPEPRTRAAALSMHHALLFGVVFPRGPAMSDVFRRADRRHGPKPEGPSDARRPRR